MDPKPTFDPTAIPRTVDLIPEVEGVGFPIPALGPVVCAALGDRLHVVTMDESYATAQHLALDRRGEPSAPAASLPVTQVVAMTACADRLVAVGYSPDGDRPVALGLGADGAVAWRSEVPVAGVGAQWPRPVCLGDRLLVVWVTWADDASTLWLAPTSEGSWDAATPIALNDPTWDLAAAPAGNGLTLARCHGDAPDLELLRIVGDQLVGRAAVADAARAVSPTIVATGDRYAVLWIAQADQALRLRWFGWGLRPLGPAETLASVSGRTQFFSARLSQGGPGQLAIRYVTETVGDGWVAHRQGGSAPDRYEPVLTHDQFVAAYDLKNGSAGAFHRVSVPGTLYDAAGWVGDRWLLIHGVFGPLITVFRALERP